MPWTKYSVKMIQEAYLDRFTNIQGYTKDTVKEANLQGKKCDLISIDGDHDQTEHDILAFHKLTYTGSYLLVDDYTSSFPRAIVGWDGAVAHGIVEPIECRKNFTMVKNSLKGWCFGRYK